MERLEIRVPDIGDFRDVPVIDVLVKPGDAVRKEDALVTLESDKATMDVPSTHSGTVVEVRLKVGDKVSQGSAIAVLEVAGAPAAAGAPPKAEAASAAESAPTPSSDASALAGAIAQQGAKSVRQALASTLASLDADLHAEVLVLGAGPGGYTAAFRAADLGRKVVLVERHATLGGVCLNVGCIPSKALLHAARVIADAEEMSGFGVSFGEPKVDLAKLRSWKDGVVGKLTRGLAALAKTRKVTVVQGTGRFASPHTLEVEGAGGRKVVSFDHCIIAAGSRAARIPGLPYDDPRLMDSTAALDLAEVPKRLLVIGGGIIGLEMATVYDALGAKVTVVEFMDRLIPGADPEIVKPLARRIDKRYERILLRTKVAGIEARKEGLRVAFEGAEGAPAPGPETFDRVLVAVGRRPNGPEIGCEKAGVQVNERGWIPVDRQMRTNVPHIFAIGDIVGEPMLAHKATHEGKLAAEVIAGMDHHAWEARTIPSVAYTDPEVAWMGLSEPEAKAKGIDYEKAVFPWSASGRALGMGRGEGLTKVLFEKGSKRILGAGIVGVNAGDLIAETVLALEMGADAEDIGLTIHPHPTLSETIFFGAEIADGTITDLMPPKPRSAGTA
ncbi:MAG TPA: dihydrolipoyl dehydrogenase [Usitatibacter sp.]|nr:dihydrolipoyl dehydrogenase [Usitatibacter sp.]